MTVFVAAQHDRLLDLWRERNARGVRLAHVDFHDDLRGLLIDVDAGSAYPVDALARAAAPVDDGNFLAHAVLEGRLSSVRWIHDLPGGRAWDVGIVRYRSDLFALRHRLVQAALGRPTYPLAFEELTLGVFHGLQPGEHLSVDWDCFASLHQDAGGIGARVSSFLDRLGDSVPPETFLAYSPGYCHPSLAAFGDFVRSLADRFSQPVEWIDQGLLAGREPTGTAAPRAPGPLASLALALRRLGLY